MKVDKTIHLDKKYSITIPVLPGRNNATLSRICSNESKLKIFRLIMQQKETLDRKENVAGTAKGARDDDDDI